MNITFDATGETSAYFDTLKAICGDTNGKSMMDIGAGFCPTTRHLGFWKTYYIDIVKRDLGEENINFMQRDILEMINHKFPDNIDVSISLDNIEHFYPEDAMKLLIWMMGNSQKQIIFTPLGDYIKVPEQGNTDPDTHKSGWTPEDFNKMGWATITFPNFHPTLNIGAFFSFNCMDIHSEFERVTNELKNKSWTK